MCRWIASVVLAGGLLTVAGAACSDQDKQPPDSVELATEKPAQPADALGQMEVAFEGNYTREQIKPVLDHALKLYGLPITEENYSRSASVLIVMRREHGVNEMDILSYMIQSHVPGVNITFPEAAAISVVFLSVGDE